MTGRLVCSIVCKNRAARRRSAGNFFRCLGGKWVASICMADEYFDYFLPPKGRSGGRQRLGVRSVFSNSFSVGPVSRALEGIFIL